MLRQSIKTQAAILTSANLFVRFIGFTMRIFLSRAIGAEAMGIAEMANSVHMLAITPVTAGLPLSVSRLTAISKPNEQTKVLTAGRWLVNRLSLFMIPLFLLLTPWIANALGDPRTFPALLFTAPCILILGHSAVLNGYCYGSRRVIPPALSEVIEQILRLFFTVLLISLFPRLSMSWSAAIPAFVTMAAEAFGLMYVFSTVKHPSTDFDHGTKDQIIRLSIPPTLSRLLNTFLRSMTAVMVPLRLQASGLTAQDAAAKLGMLNGMAMPLVMLPGIFTGALSMIAAPVVAANEKNIKKLRGVTAKLLVISFFISGGCAIGLYIFSDPIAILLFRQPDVADILKHMTPCVVLMGVSQVLSGMTAGMGLQKQCLFGTLLGTLINLLLTWHLTVIPHLRQIGAVQAMNAGYAVAFIWQAAVMLRALIIPADDKSCAVQP